MAISVVAIGNTDPIQTSGGEQNLSVSDSDSQQSLKSIVRGIKEMNFHLQTITGNYEISEEIQ